jgi:predicted ATPase
MIFEDAHWTDPTTLELFGRVVDRVRSLRVLLIVTFRPDFDPPWVGRAYVTFLAINRLGEPGIIAMIGAAAHAGVNRIVGAADGHLGGAAGYQRLARGPSAGV